MHLYKAKLDPAAIDVPINANESEPVKWTNKL